MRENQRLVQQPAATGATSAVGYQSKDGTVWTVTPALGLPGMSSGGSLTGSWGVGWCHARSFVLVFADNLSAEVNEGFIHVCPSAGTSFEVWNIPLARDCEGSWARHCSVFFKIRLVADQDHGHVAVFLYSPYLLPQLRKLPEG
jgi:hypothetical protein